MSRRRRGTTAFTRNPSIAKRCAIDRITPSTPPFDAQYAVSIALPKRPSIEEMNTAAEPGPASRKGSRRAFEIMAAAAQVDVQGPVPQLVVDEVDRHRPGHPGRVDEAAERAERCGGFHHAVRDRCRVGNVDGGPLGSAAVRVATERGGLLRALRIDVPDRNRAAHLGERQCGSPSDARAATGNQHAGRRGTESVG